ncbi:MAG: glucose-6-phosphate dehydrogenase [Aeromicrobium sp.]
MGNNPLRDPRDRRLPQIAGPCSIVIFGITGDLARRKLIPAIYDLANRGLLPPGFALVGFARQDTRHEDFVEYAREAVKAGARTPWHETTWKQMAAGLRCVYGSFDEDESWEKLVSKLQEIDDERGTGGNHAFYLSIPPALFPLVVSKLKKHGLAQSSGAWRRVVIEKPFGHDLASAQELNALVAEVFPRESVFRIDHYLGKETVQNILAFRFANGMFEPLWNSNYVDHVQITMAEDIGIGSRAAYYDGIGAARDVIQNHLLQLMALIAMEEPVSFNANSLQIEKQKILANARPPARMDLHTAHAQYEEGWAGGVEVLGYKQELDIPAHSTTETFAAMRIDIATRRWAGVPFYLRTGKRLGRRVTEVAVVFQRAPHQPFGRNDTEELGQNALVMRIQPDEGVTLRFGAKVPGTAMEIRDVSMDFAYGGAFVESSPEAYERLILDVLLGDPPLFPQVEEVELAWKILDPVIDHWARSKGIDTYASGTWGPESADKMMARDGRTWRRP